MERLLPNFLILGSAKCATTSLHFYLQQHPEIYMTPKKECHFFCHQDVPEELYEPRYQPTLNLDGYRRLFAKAGHAKIRGECSPMYLYYQQSAERIHSQIPTAKLVAVLRNPADRAYSAYLHAVRDGIENLSFEDAIAAEKERMASGRFSATHAYYEFGCYFRKLKPYFERFPAEQIRLYLYEELNGNMAEALVDICKFLAVTADHIFDTRPRLNVSGVPRRQWAHKLAQFASGNNWAVSIVKKPFTASAWVRLIKWMQYSNYEKPGLDPGVRRRVLALYADEIQAASKLIGRDLA